MRMEILKRMVKPDREYEAVFRYGEREYETPPITGEELIRLVDEASGGGAVVSFYGPTLAIYYDEGGVMEVDLG